MKRIQDADLTKRPDAFICCEKSLDRNTAVYPFEGTTFSVADDQPGRAFSLVNQ